MPGYNVKGLKRFGHKAPARRQDSPHEHAPIKYGANAQYATEEDTSKPLDEQGTKRVQQINGTYLFSGRAVDSPLLVALGSLASQQSKATEKTKAKAKQLLDFIASQEEPVLTYRASDMILAAHSNASYL